MARAIKKGDTVKVIYGRDNGKTGKVTRVIPRKNLVVVAGINVVTRHIGRRSGTNQPGRVKRDAPLPLSSVEYMDPDTQKSGRVGWRVLDDLTKERFIRNGRES